MLEMWTYIRFVLLVFHVVRLGTDGKNIFDFISGKLDDVGPRSFLLDRNMHWPDGFVPYEMDPKFSPSQVKQIEENMKVLASVSCIRWGPRTNQRDYIEIVHADVDTRCSSPVGRSGGRQRLRLGDKCFTAPYRAAILHEMMHALGFIHEQQRLDRDCYIWVYNETITKKPYDFAIALGTSTSFPYDFNSIMHYGASKDMGLKQTATHNYLGNKHGNMTEMDVMKLNFLYCGGQSYCQINLIDCLQRKEAERRCTYKPASWHDYVTFKYHN